MLSPDYFNGPANTQYPEDSFITHCLVSCFLLLCALPLITYFINSIWQTFVCIKDIIKHTYFCIAYIFKTSYSLYCYIPRVRSLSLKEIFLYTLNKLFVKQVKSFILLLDLDPFIPLSSSHNIKYVKFTSP